MIETNGIHLHVLELGPPTAKRTIVMLHGFPEGSYAWADMGQRLAALGYRVWVPDQRGYNLSDKPARVAEYHSDALARDVLGLIDKAGCEQVDLIGHDWGGQVAWWTAARYPDRIRRLVVINCPHPNVMLRNLMTNPRQMLKSWYIFMLQLPWLPEWLLRRNGLAPMRKLIHWPGGPAAEEAERFVEAWSRPRAFTSMVNWYRAALRGRPLPREESRIRVPALLIWAERDLYLERSMAKQSINRCENGRLVYLPDATHWVHHEKPDALVRLIDKFLAED